jgi:trans-aconitate methyltransferase
MIAGDDEVVLDIASVREQLERRCKGLDSKINYVCDRNFDLRRFKSERIDLVFSQAAFEHFDDIPETFAQLSDVVLPGGVLIAQIDLSTHTRWIRDRDPLNIYRYPDFYYDLFRFRGSPNRLRPNEYKGLLEKQGWKGVRIIPTHVLGNDHMASVQNRLASRFRSPASHMEQLSVMLCATR